MAIQKKSALLTGALMLLVTVASVGIFAVLNKDSKELEEKFASAAEITDAELGDFIVNCGTVDITAGVTSCVLDLQQNQDLPTAGLKLGIGNATEAQIDSSSCALVGAGPSVQCTNVSVGTIPGIQPVYAKVNTTTQTLTKSYVKPENSIGGGAFYTFSFDGPVHQGGVEIEKGGTAPLFKNDQDITVNVKGLQTDLGDTPGATGNPYTCKIEVRAMRNWKDETVPYTVLADNVSYDEVNGCSAIFSKTTRGNGLNWSFQTTITNDTTGDVYYVYDNYILRFSGFGA